MKLTGAQILWECLVREGVTDVFGYPGGAILPAYDAMLDYPIRHVLVRHEQGATHMADGYARASGKVGVAIATSGPGATNMVTGIATAMMDSSPIVCITGQVGSRLIGSDAFQEIDITGITLPVTKHNYLVTRADDVAARGARSVRRRKVRPARARPHRHHQGCAAVVVRVRLGGGGAGHAGLARRARGACDIARPGRGAAERSAAPGHPRRSRRSDLRRDGTSCRRSPSAPRFPVAMTLLGIGCMPASHALNIGMMGMHGEAWVNHAIQEADLLIAAGMRFDDRVTGNLKTYAPNAKKIHIEIDPSEINKNVPVDVALIGDLLDVLKRLMPSVAPGNRQPWLQHINGIKGDCRGPRHPVAARRRASVCGARHQRPVARDAQHRHHRRHRRRSAPDVGGAVLPSRGAAIAHHLGRARHDGLCRSGGDRRQAGAARSRSLGDRAATAASR